MTGADRYPIHVDFAGDYKPGDPPPKGYTQWHEWARVQHKAGRRQFQCRTCGLWKFRQEKCNHKEK